MTTTPDRRDRSIGRTKPSTALGRRRWRSSAAAALLGLLIVAPQVVDTQPAAATVDGNISLLGSLPGFQSTRPGDVVDVNYMVRNSSNLRPVQIGWGRPNLPQQPDLTCQPGPDPVYGGSGVELGPNSSFVIRCTFEVPATGATSAAATLSVISNGWLHTISESVTIPIDSTYAQVTGHGDLTPGGTFTGMTFDAAGIGFPGGPGPYTYRWRIYDVATGALVHQTTQTLPLNEAGLTIPRSMLTPIALGTSGAYRWRAVAQVTVTRGSTTELAVTPTVTASGS